MFLHGVAFHSALSRIVNCRADLTLCLSPCSMLGQICVYLLLTDLRGVHRMEAIGKPCIMPEGNIYLYFEVTG